MLANIYLHVPDRELACRNVGELVRYADDGVVLCRSTAQARRSSVSCMRESRCLRGAALHQREHLDPRKQHLQGRTDCPPLRLADRTMETVNVGMQGYGSP
jgi:hypothetical protein